ncbi:MAG: DUF4093 domain-containing protein [Oscillospiraceae bacterium]|nr:DUF4093 domain-containing protein [Oscillospiraceae bacterium]
MRTKPTVREAVVVEGRYDKNSLLQVVDAVVLETSGFGIFNDRQKQRLLRSIAETRGLIVLTDPDGAGFMIRNFIRGCVDPALVKHAYIPDIPGRERRKTRSSKEGKLGVEGMPPEILLNVLRRAGAAMVETPGAENPDKITKADFYARGLSGREGSAARRKALLRKLDLPERLSADGLLDVLNAIMTREDFYRLDC